MTGDHQSLLGLVAGTLCCTGFHVCNLAFDSYGGIVMWIAIMLYMFKALGTVCDEYFVPSLEVIVEKLQLSNDVAGATFMAAGSSAPELFTSLVATFLIVNESGVGTIVGSAIFNILVIVGATGFIACKDQSLKIWWYPLSRDCFFYAVAIVELMVILQNESVEWYEGLIMFFTYCLYIVYMYFNPAIIRLLGIENPEESESLVQAVDQSSQIAVTEMTSKDEIPRPSKDTPPKDEAGGVSNGSTQSGGSALRSLASGEATDEKSGEIKPPEMIGKQASAPGTMNTEEVKEEDVKDTVVEITGATQAASRNSLGSSGSNSNKLDPQNSPRGDGPRSPSKDQRRPSWSYADSNRESPRDSKGKIGEGDGIPAPLCVPEEQPKRWIRDPLDVFWELSMPSPDRWGGSALFFMSIFFIGMCTYVMVDAVNRTGQILHIPQLAMALVFLAAGTSIPDALGSIAVAKQGEGDMAVANALGSNVFDILIGLGVPWFIKTGLMGKKVEFRGNWKELKYDIIVLVFVLFLFVGCLLANKWRLTRKMGVVLLCLYVGFLVYNVFAIWVFDPALKSHPAEGVCITL